MLDEALTGRRCVFTIGHSNLPIERFVSTLQEAGIVTLIDVRSAPFSRYSPWFNRDALEFTLRSAGIDYRFGGDYLGGRPSDPACYRSGKLPGEGANYLEEVDYEEVARRPWFVRGLDRLKSLADETTVAVMCSEEDPEQCHRHHLIAQALLDDGDVVHIRTSGTTGWRVSPAMVTPKQTTLF
jgi:uncharacterized protein (DUF488 family)